MWLTDSTGEEDASGPANTDRTHTVGLGPKETRRGENKAHFDLEQPHEGGYCD